MLKTPGLERVHDAQRAISYALAIIVGLVIDIPLWRATVFIAVISVQLAASVYRLVTRRPGYPYVLAQIDHALAPVLIALATASPLFSLALGILIAASNAVTFRAPLRLALGLATVWTIPGVVIAVLLSNGVGGQNTSAAILLLELTTAGILMLVYFAFQSRQLRKALSQREREIEAVLEVTPVLLAKVHDGRVTVLGGDTTEWRGSPAVHLTASSDIQEIVRTASVGKRVRREVTVAGRALSVRCEPGASGGLLLTAYDVTDQAEARQKLEALVRTKDQFIAAVSHKLRTPLTSVLGFSEILQETIREEDVAQSILGEVVGQSAEMSAIIDDLLVAGRSSFDAIVMNPRSIEVTEEIKAVANSIAVRVSTPVEYDLQSAVAVADPVRFRQVVRNLITNADRYGGETVRVCSRAEHGEVVVAVQDSGPPIPAEVRRRIFDPYVSVASDKDKGQPAAVGLGLAVSQTLAELMGGSVVYHHDGEWSVFELRLPRSGAHIALGSDARVPAAATQRSG